MLIENYLQSDIWAIKAAQLSAWRERNKEITKGMTHYVVSRNQNESIRFEDTRIRLLTFDDVQGITPKFLRIMLRCNSVSCRSWKLALQGWIGCCCCRVQVYQVCCTSCRYESMAAVYVPELSTMCQTNVFVLDCKSRGQGQCWSRLVNKELRSKQ